MKTRRRLKEIENKTFYHVRNVNYIIDIFLDDFTVIEFNNIKMILFSEMDKAKPSV